MTILQIATWGAEAIKAVVGVIADAVNGAEPPTLEELRARVQVAIDARHADWIKAARDEADATLDAAAQAEFDAALAAELGKPKP